MSTQRAWRLRPRQVVHLLLALLAAAVLLALLVACDDHEGEHCTDHYTVMTPVKIGKVTTYQMSTYCSHWEPDPTPSPK